MKYISIAILALTFFSWSSGQTDEEITTKIIQLIQNQPERWITIQTLRNLIYNFKSDDGHEEITISIRKTVPSTVVMLYPYKVEFSPDSSAKLESEFNNRYCHRLKST